MLTEDYELTREDVQLLASRDALTAFFARLGYDTNHRLVQNVAAMSITSDSLKSSITHIERLASQHGRMFEIYLFELKSVTIAITQNIVRTFRNRSGDFLLVLTDDYQRLDFVLVERYSPEFPKLQDALTIVPAVPKQAGVRPRVLTVNRRQPDQVALRVLRRFSYTETDTLAQYEKLLSAYDVADWSEPFFNNRALFSDYYLTRRLPQAPEWEHVDQAAAMTRAFKQLRELYADVRETFSNQPEAVVRTKLLEPVLTTLGFTFQPVKAGVGDTVQPDYKLYITNSVGRAYNKPLALCLAYTWGRNLDGKDEQRDSQAPDENPGAAVVTLLDSGEADWAIVTNGKTWRLYAAKAHSRATNYYEIDLEETLALPAANLEHAFRYFWLLFRASAFVPTERVVEGEQRQMCFLDSLLNESERYARELGERLKKRVFEEIFPHFARGFIIYARRNGQLPSNLHSLSPAEQYSLLEPFFSGTLTFLYRLLFLLYAESRDLLPVRELRGYYEKSLEKLKNEIADKAGRIEDEAPARIKAAYNDLSTTLYDRLQALFQAVDQGEATLNVPVYNGGLFVTAPDPADPSPEATVARFLATHKVSDRQLALGLDRMARDPDEKRLDLVSIDYKSLGVRQLGSIYEGLLEFRLCIATEEMAIVKGKKTEEIVPYAEAQQKKLPILKEGRGNDAHYKTLPKDTVYLENDRRERKATGSYYTPDYIVKYIIANTVGPVLHEKLEALRPAFREAEKTLRAERAKYDALKKQGRVGDTPENQAYLKHRATVNEVFFDLKVLDPAMGSGHFLVEAVDYITDRMADFLTAFKWNPVIHELARTRHEIQEEMERQGVTIDMSKLTDINLLKRQVLKRCIYGVDLNPMAVELAKVSLWLDCFTLGAPLSFLDHHMKCGNSLIGAWVDEARKTIEEGQLSLFFGSNLWASALLATKTMIEVGSLSDVTIDQAQASREKYHKAVKELEPYRHLFNVYLSRQFSNPLIQRKKDNTAIDKVLDFLRSAEAQEWVQRPHTTTLAAEQQTVVFRAEQDAASHNFFHWELEFPEVFIDLERASLKTNPGFDAVVGNPPYVRQEGLGENKTAFKAMYEVFNSIADLYTYFIERGHSLLRPGGRFGMITANKFMRANYGGALRSFLTGKARLEKLIDFGELRVFGDAATDPLITISSNATPAESIGYVKMKSLDFEVLDKVVQADLVMLPESAFSDSSWSLVANSEQAVLDKLKANSIPLGEYVGGIIRRGILTGFNEAFVIDRATRDRLIAENPKSSGIIKPFIVGDDVRRYYLDFNEQYLIFTRRGIDLAKYTSIEQHLLQYKTQLEPRPSSWNEKIQGEWPGRKPGPYKWYEIQDNIAYYTDFEKAKILYPEIAMTNRFTLDEEGHYTNNKAFLIPKNDRYLLALLNSQLIWFYLKKICSVLGDAEDGGRLELRSIHVETAPIRRITFNTGADECTRLLEKARNLYEYCMIKDDQTCVAGFVEHHLSKEPEESDVVHDLLAFLAEEMIRLNKERRAATKEFLDWLVTTLKILPDKDGRKGIDALVGKSKLLDYPGDYQKGESPLAFEELRDILLKNKARLGVSLSNSGLVDQIKVRYEESLGLVLPVKERLVRTDALIDQVVYRLYGLTEEEIKIVEGKR